MWLKKGWFSFFSFPFRTSTPFSNLHSPFALAFLFSFIARFRGGRTPTVWRLCGFAARVERRRPKRSRSVAKRLRRKPKRPSSLSPAFPRRLRHTKKQNNTKASPEDFQASSLLANLDRGKPEDYQGSASYSASTEQRERHQARLGDCQTASGSSSSAIMDFDRALPGSADDDGLAFRLTPSPNWTAM